MAVGAGDAISAMAAYLSRHSEELLAGTRVLTLSTRELARVTARLQQLARLSELGGGPGGQTPNDWSRQLDHWHASDLEYLRRLEYVRALLEGLRTLRVDEHDLHAGDGNPPTPPVTTSRMTSHERRRQQLPSALSLLSLAPFASLARLELRGCDLAAATRQPIWDGNLVRGLREVRAHLEELHLRGCVGTLAMIFVAEGESATSAHDKPPAATWPRLRSLAYVGGELLGGETDASVGACCPELTSLDLRRNGLHATDQGGTGGPRRLTRLDLGFNRIRSARRLYLSLHANGAALTSLSLRGNRLRSTKGLELLKSLRSLDVAGNLLRSMRRDVTNIADNLPRLRRAWLEDNPLASVAGYRTQALACWPDERDIELDGRAASKFDRFALRHYRKATQLRDRMRRMRPGTNGGTSDDDDDDDDDDDAESEDANSEDDDAGGFEPTTEPSAPATPATPPLPASTPPPSVLAARRAPSSSSSSSRLRRRRRRRGGVHARPKPSTVSDRDVSDREDEEATRAAVMSGFDTFWHGFELEPKTSLAGGETTALEDASSPSSPPPPSSPTREIRVPSPANPGEPGEDSDSNSNDARYLSSSAPSRSPASTAPRPSGRHPIRGGFGTGRAPGHGRHLSLELNKPPPRFAGISRVMDLTSFESDAEHRADDDEIGTATPRSDGSRSQKSPKPDIPALRSRRRAARTSEGIESDDTTDDSEEDVAGLYSPLRLSKTTTATMTTEAGDGGGWEDGDDGERMGGIPSARELFAASDDAGALPSPDSHSADHRSSSFNPEHFTGAGGLHGGARGDIPGRELARTFRARVARNAAAETFLGAFSCSRMRSAHGDLRVGLGVPPDSAEPGEEPVTVMVSDARVYVCRPDAGAAALWSCALADVGSALVGAGRQMLCLVPSLDESSRSRLAPATLVTRCSETTGAMIAAVVAAASAVDAVVEVSDAAAASQLSCARRMLARRSEESGGGKSPPGFRSGATSPDTGAGARDDDGEGQGDATEVRAYAMVFLRSRRGAGSTAEPRTLILTDDVVAVAEEDASGFRERFAPGAAPGPVASRVDSAAPYLRCERSVASALIAGVDVGWTDVAAAAAAMAAAEGRTPAAAPMACVTMTFRRGGDPDGEGPGRARRGGRGRDEPPRGEEPWEMVIAASEAVRLQTLVGSWGEDGARNAAVF